VLETLLPGNVPVVALKVLAVLLFGFLVSSRCIMPRIQRMVRRQDQALQADTKYA
jgi:hypothetical protein